MHVYSTLTHLHDLGKHDGLECGRREGHSRQLGKLLSRAGKRLFGPPGDGQRDRLDLLARRQALEALRLMRDRLLDDADWDALLEGAEPPAEEPSQPDYLVPVEIDLGPTSPSIDEFAEVNLGGRPMILHVRMQRLYQADIGAILYKEAQRIQKERGCAVQTVVTLLHEGADGPAMTGEYQPPGGGRPYRYAINRIWERDVEEMLSSIGTAYLAPLGKGAPERLPEIVRRMEEVIDAGTEEHRNNLWLVAYGNLGLRYPADLVNEVLAHKLPYLYSLPGFRGFLSRGYHEGFHEGLEQAAVEESRAWVLALGRRRLGEPAAEVASALEGLRSLDRLEQLATRVVRGASWAEVLAPH